MELREYKLDFILRCTRDEQEKLLFGKIFLVKIKGEYYVGKFDYATPIHPEISLSQCHGTQAVTSYEHLMVGKAFGKLLINILR